MLEDVKLAVGAGAHLDFHGTPGGLTPLIDDIIERIESYAG
jgi:hypothetical protein